MSRTAKKKPMIGPKMSLAVTTALASVALAGCSTNAAPLAETSFQKAQVALEKGQVDKAIAHAEAAVLSEPRNSGYRALLGAAYLEAGRFASAATSFSDAIELGDSDPRTVLSYALAEVALGNNAAAVDMLNQWQDEIGGADLGLALALAGETDRGVHILGNAVRAGDESAKVRQNLAYAYALQGNWRAARVMAAEDVPADQLDQRLSDWAESARPEDYQRRVASLLNVAPAADGGQPTHLALANFPSHGMMVAEAAAEIPAEDATMLAYGDVDGEELPAADVPGQFAVAEEYYTPVASAEPASRYVSNEVVQALPAGYVEARPAPVSRVAANSTQRRMAATVDQTEGTHLVQLGSFSSRAGAERAWSIYQKRYSQLSGREAVITEAKVKGKTYYRVAAAGFGAASARAMCSTVKATGKGCFAYAESSPMPGTVASQRRLAAR
ncbi:SPOR domain-containing protein [Altererythrobacter arenosus]|uniref:SPOR domain-containing protein n=1 Tax=Altererythrobacter arenosus TaxID=3032592 RepID=A0ABY8FSZ9_9SPHN|nr:SPOR domain-containing protein [Altererythrobacter sp. CAU 1644]WFL78133.1 SPOR domain-containing protein [Altererythrobacter sp. CAU 1644]